jgi:hypothetical protein
VPPLCNLSVQASVSKEAQWSKSEARLDLSIKI